MAWNDIADILRSGKRFFLVSHKDPDGDAIGSMLALGQTLLLSGKEIALFNEGPISDSLASLEGVEHIKDHINQLTGFDAFFVLDCGNLERTGRISSDLLKKRPLINIDHHKNNTQFGQLNLVEAQRSSVGEIIYRLIRMAGLPMNVSVAENIFVAIQTDTGSFRYDNTTREAFTIAGELLDWGVDPWKISRKVMDGYTLKRLRLLESALKTIELHFNGKVGLITITQTELSKIGAEHFDSEGFVDYVRFISGVEIGVFVREINEGRYKFSLRSNNWVNVADLASRFGGGGHSRAAAFTAEGSFESVKQDFLSTAQEILENIRS